MPPIRAEIPACFLRCSDQPGSLGVFVCSESAVLRREVLLHRFANKVGFPFHCGERMLSAFGAVRQETAR
jgi:hypothetical protein